ncbi:APOBEC1 complementation factor-like [Frankliniella occidentalis]|uniref:APOBEC1 complementation factor-like n=1 Tax=Frankliniella occidentalis TaxID=133901 RepID=A0A6J1T6G5_FRAOC|nr:APOBEC1 complementation factor-like [Frankliniella occidentalis]
MSVIRMIEPPVAPTTEEVWHALVEVLGPRVMSMYELKQINGQRKLYQPRLSGTPPPVEGCEVFVGRLPRDLYEDELVPPFLQIGPIYEVRMMMNFSGTNRGFAFITYFDRETAKKAIRKLDNFPIRWGQAIGVLASINNKRLYFGNLPNFKELRSKLYTFLKENTEGVHQLHLRTHDKGTANAIVTYSSHRAAAMARRALIPVKDFVFGPRAIIDWADPAL